MIKVLVVDDSLFMRRMISDMLNSDSEIVVVDTAKDGTEALDKALKIKPDVVTLDLVMPGWDGLTTLKHIMDEYPTPVVILSAHSKKQADITIECLDAGAIGFVLKPSGELSLNIEDIKHELLKEIKAASNIDVRSVKSLIRRKTKRPKSKLITVKKMIVIGASTGGPQTLETLLSFLPTNFPASVIVVQHMPTIFFTESLAEHLNRVSQLKVKVAEDKEIIQHRKIYLAPAGFQLTLKPLRNKNIIICLAQEKENVLGPSIDITMKSIAKIYKEKTMGIILSGMGHDGLEGIKAIKNSGGRAIVQDDSSLIFGMPKAVIDAGYADEVLPVNEIISEMVKYVS